MNRMMPALAMLAACAASAQSIDRPTVRVGSECVYEVFDNLAKDRDGKPELVAETHNVFTEVEPGRISGMVTRKMLVEREIDDIDAGPAMYDADLNLTEMAGRKFEPAFPQRIYPLTAEVSRTAVKSAFPSRKGARVSATLDGKASAWEKVAVPAGDFDVLPVTWEGTLNVQDGMLQFGLRYFQQIALSSATPCLVTRVTKTVGGKGTIVHLTYRLKAFKN